MAQITQQIIGQIPQQVNEGTSGISAQRDAGYDEGGNIPISGYQGVFNINGQNYTASYDSEGNLNDISFVNNGVVDRYVPGVGSFSQKLVGKNEDNFFKNVLSNPVTQVALAYYLPGVGEALGAQLGVSSAVGTALASTAVQVANGVDFDTALKNATVNAVVQTGSPTGANDIAKAVGSSGVADAFTSAGASIASTLAKGGNMSEALNNAGAAIPASGASQAADSRAVGAAVGGGITGGATGAALGLAGEAGRPAAGGKGVQVAAAGTDPSVVSDTPSDVGLQTITSQKDPSIAGTDVQVVDALRRQTGAAPTTAIPEVTVTAPKEPANIAATDIGVIDVVGKRDSFPTVTVTAPREPAAIGDTDIQVEDPITDAPPEEEPAEDAGYDPNLFIYSGFSKKGPGTLGQTLGTNLQAPFYPKAGAASSLTGERAAGEIEASPGTERQNVWNEASLRLKDALGI